MKKLIGIIITITTIIFASCEKDVTNVDLPDFKEKLVVQCFLNPDDTVTYIGVSVNKPIFGVLKDYGTTGNLSGTISDGVNEVTLSRWSAGLYFNHVDMPVEEGKTYFLKVESSKGYSTEASCTVPIRGSYLIEADTSIFTIDYGIPEGAEYDYFGPINYATQYVRVNAFMTDYSEFKGYYTASLYYEVIDTTSWIHHSKGYISPLEAGFLSDPTTAQKRSLGVEYSTGYNYGLVSGFVTVYLLSTDKEYYTYQQSFKNYNEGELFSEVSPLYSNIKGGLGIFSSYLVADSIRVNLK